MAVITKVWKSKRDAGDRLNSALNFSESPFRTTRGLSFSGGELGELGSGRSMHDTVKTWHAYNQVVYPASR